MFKERLKELREKNGLKQCELAQKLLISKGSISNYERGIREPGITVLCYIADYFNVTADYLLCRTNSKNNINKNERR